MLVDYMGTDPALESVHPFRRHPFLSKVTGIKLEFRENAGKTSQQA